MKTYQGLIVWRKAVDYTVYLYKVTDLFPSNERYGLVSQMRRAAVAIPSNIAEGYCRRYRREYIQFLRIAFASGAELETQWIIAEKLGFIDRNVHNELYQFLSEIMKMLNNLIKSLNPSG